MVPLMMQWQGFFAKLDHIYMENDLPWCVGGDFNEVLYSKGRYRYSKRSGGMELFGD